MLALCLVLQVQADTLLGKVINVADGDSITVLDDTNTQHKIRLTGIDAPEKRQAFGNVFKQSLADMVAGQSVTVEWVKTIDTGASWARCCWPVWIATWCRSSAARWLLARTRMPAPSGLPRRPKNRRAPRVCRWLVKRSARRIKTADATNQLFNSWSSRHGLCKACFNV